MGAMRTFTTAVVLAVAALGSLGATMAGAAAPGDACAQVPTARTVAYERLPGVAANLTSLDLYAPPRRCHPSRGAPVVLWVHGGGYHRGDKANQVRDKVRLLTGAGYVFASVNYRLTRVGDPASAHWPDHFRDVAAAVAWTRRHIRRWGGDPRRIVVLGHSAGADIVANVTTDPRWLGERRLGLTAVRCAGPLDTAGFDKVRATDREKAQWISALGNAPDFERTTSATHLIRPGIGTPATLTVVRGTPNRQSIEQSFAARLREVGVPVTVIDARALSHEQVNTRIGAPGDTVMTPALLTFLRDCSAGAARR
jgi:arylformamidase